MSKSRELTSIVPGMPDWLLALNLVAIIIGAVVIGASACNLLP